MARSDASILGDFTGRIGNIIVYKLNRKTVMRIRPAGRKEKPAEGMKESLPDLQEALKKIYSKCILPDWGVH